MQRQRRAPGGRQHRVTVRFTDDEAALLADRAEACGWTEAKYIHECVVKAHPVSTESVIHELYARRADLNRATANANAIARVAYTAGAQGWMVERLEGAAARIEACRDDYLATTDPMIRALVETAGPSRPVTDEDVTWSEIG